MKLCIKAVWGMALALSFSPLKTVHAQSAVSAEVPKLDSESRIVLQSISARYKKLGNWGATFTQETFSVGLGKGTFNEGRFVFVGPNKFRYSLVQPEVSDFFSDGKKAWFVQYPQGRGKSADVKSFAKLSAIELNRYLVLLRGFQLTTPKAEAEFLRDFAVKGRKIESDLVLELEPRKSGEIVRITLIFRNDVSAPYRAKLEDAIGNTTTVTINTFDSIKKVDPKWFAPDYPTGSKVEKL